MSIRRFALATLLSLTAVAAIAADSRPSTATAGVRVLEQELTIPRLDRNRTLRIYLPPGYARGTRRYPVLYMHDAQNLFDDATSYVGEWGVDEAMDALARSQGIELIVVGIDHGQDKRINELSPWENPRYGAAEGRQYMEFVVNTVKPFIDREYRTRAGPDDTGIMGSSLGALASHYAIHEYPAVFGKAGIFSPSYWYAAEVYEHARTHRLRPGSRLYLVAGSEEGDSTSADLLRMDRQLRTTGNRRLSIHTAIRAGGAHNEGFWKKEFPLAVVWMYGRRRASVPPDDDR